MLPLATFGKKTDLPVLCNNALKMVGLLTVLLWKLAALVIYVSPHDPCFTALNPLDTKLCFRRRAHIRRQSLPSCLPTDVNKIAGLPFFFLPANFEMNVVVSHIDVVTSSSSEENVRSGLEPGPWVDFSTFSKLALVVSFCSYLTARFSPCLSFSFPKLALP